MLLFPKYQGPSLLEQICSVENLTHAWRRVESNIRVSLRGKSAGPDAVTLHDFAADWPNQMARLADDLRTGTYQAQPPRRVTIPKRSGGERAIAILTVRDRIAQRAVQQVLEPLFDPFFLDCSFGCRPRVGVPHALTQVERYAAQGRTWVVDADVTRYFDSLDQRILLGLVRQRITEVAILRLIAGWLETGTLHEMETAPLSAPSRSLLQRGGQALRNLAAAAQTGPPVPPTPPMPAAAIDPYAAAAWEQPYRDRGSLEQPMLSFDPHLGHPAPQDALGNRVMTAVMLVKPVVAGARVAWPHLQRFGGRRLALAGAVAAGTVAAGELAYRQWSGRRGTPQGGALSPLLANIYLHPFDVALTSQGLRLVRFMDDFVIMCTGPTEAEQALNLARQQLATLRLTLNMEKTRIVDYAEGLEFLGQALLPRRTESRRFQGITSFTDAEQQLRETARAARKKVQRAHGKPRERNEEQES
jgi:RNA-directed DNA polymerase